MKVTRLSRFREEETKAWMSQARRRQRASSQARESTLPRVASQAYGEVFDTLPWDWFATFTVRGGSSLEYLQRCHDHWTRLIEAEAGQPLRQAFAIDQHRSGQPHAHVLINGVLSTQDPRRAGALWRAISGGIARLSRYVDHGGAASYIAKVVRRDAEIRLLGPWPELTQPHTARKVDSSELSGQGGSVSHDRDLQPVEAVANARVSSKEQGREGLSIQADDDARSKASGPAAASLRGGRNGRDPRGALGVIVQPRLLSPEQAATYLGLGSRWAIYRLIDRGDLPAVRLAAKLRLDRGDLDRLIETRKGALPGSGSEPRPWRPRRVGGVPQNLAPLSTRNARRLVTIPVTGARPDA